MDISSSRFVLEYLESFLLAFLEDKKNIFLTNRNQWREVGEVVSDTYSIKVTSLENQKKYKFRIRAWNKIGKSEPADLPETVLAKDPWGKSADSETRVT